MIILRLSIFYIIFGTGWLVPTISLFGYLSLDTYSCLFSLLTVRIILFVLGFSKSKRLNTLIGILLIVLILSFSVSSFILFFVFFELSLIPMVIMILGWGSTPERLTAGSYILMYTLVSSVPLLFMLFRFYAQNEDLTFFTFKLLNSKGCMFDLGLKWFFVFWILGFFVKIPVYGFHLWLTKAHVEAPVYGSMLLAAVLLKLGVYGLYRRMYFWNLEGLIFFPYLQVFLLIGFTCSGIICFRQIDIKSLIAYSSVQHMMLGVIGIFSYRNIGNIGVLWISVSHGFVSRAMFFIFGVLYQFSGRRNLLLNRGIIKLFPIFVFIWMFSLSLKSAFPPSGNFFSEIFLISSVVEMGPFMFPFFIFSI